MKKKAWANFCLLVLLALSVQAQPAGTQLQSKTVDATAVPALVAQQLQRLAPGFQEPSWEYYSCEQCPEGDAYHYYKVDFFQEDKPASLAIGNTGNILAFQLRTRLADLPSPVQQVDNKRAQRTQQDYKGVEFEIYSFTEGSKVLYNIVFYIPTEDKKHWTPYDEINVTDKGSLVKLAH